jgi:structural maintenance of chromosome 2
MAVASAQAERDAAGGEWEALQKQIEAAQQSIAGAR